MADAAQKSEFIDRAWKAVQSQPSLGGLFPSVIIAQAALESAWGQSRLAADYNNYFGVKASSTQYSPAWNPKTSPSVNLDTLEYSNGYNTENATWRVYKSLADSMRDRNALVSTNPRYASALVADSPRKQVEAMKSGGYATDPKYVDKIMATIQSNNLTQYDSMYTPPASHGGMETATTGHSSRRGDQFLKTVLVLLLLVLAGYFGYKLFRKYFKP